jgi:DNA mismatch repair protein MutL
MSRSYEIKILPDFIANQIAAGEVVQRPESVVKELVENSLDAGANEIEVTINDSGKGLIHISDNGRGMTFQDLELATRRHATSKVYTQEDLQSIISFGFRGEALASISSVAKLEIRTRTANDQAHGWQLLSEPNSEIAIIPIECPFGTQIFVRNLFFNVPARRKFLKSDTVEHRKVSQTITALAIANPECAFFFGDGKKTVFHAKPSILKERIREVLGQKVYENLLEINLEDEFINIYGFVGKPQIAKASKSGQYLFLNGRPIQNKSLSHAIFSSFGPLLGAKQHPQFVIMIDIAPETVDINVHPQKHEVKFEDERLVYNALRTAVKTSLQENNLTSSLALNGGDQESKFFEPQRQEENRKTDNYKYSKPKQKSTRQTEYKNNITSSQRMAFDEIYSRKDENKFEDEIENKILQDSQKIKFWQLHNKYIFTHTEKGVLIIDQHNAHERINYERALETLDKEFSGSQKLLFPVELNINSVEQSSFDEIKSELETLGFIFDLSQKITVLSIPLDLKSGKIEEELKEILDNYSEYKTIKPTERRDNIAASFACRKSIKTGQKLSNWEMEQLFEDLMNCQTPSVCPHGRPVVLEMSIPDLDKSFGRSPDNSFLNK